jgi:hypothetical protein
VASSDKRNRGQALDGGDAEAIDLGGRSSPIPICLTVCDLLRRQTRNDAAAPLCLASSRHQQPEHSMAWHLLFSGEVSGHIVGFGKLFTVDR